MKRFAFVVAVIVFSGAMLSNAWAQENGQKTYTVQNGNTTIVFEPANGQDLNLNELRAFSQLANDDPAMDRALAKDPVLIKNEAFVGKHPALQQFLSQNPRAQEDFLADPGNFVVPASKWAKAAKRAKARAEM